MAVLFVLLPVSVFISIFALLQRPSKTPPDFRTVRDSYKTSDAVLLDRYGEVIHELRIDEKGRRLEWADLKDISPVLQKIIIHSEDRKFYDHRGVDWQAIASASIKNLVLARKRGASTITMQLASLLDKGLQPKNRRSLRQKWEQIRYATALENGWSKQEILESYLNLVSFRGELQGITSASRGLFGKDPHGLNDMESLILVSLLRSPNASIEQVINRAYLLGNATGLDLRREAVESAVKGALSGPHFIKPRMALAPHVAVQLLKTGSNDKNLVESTLDGSLQLFAIETLRQHLLSVSSQNVQDGAVLVVENKTGDVLAYVGSSGELSESALVDGVRAKRQAGSILKPFLYSLAVDNRILTAGSVIDDSPLDIPAVNGVYRPSNYDSQFKGLVTARTALASSLNVPAVKVLQIAGIETFLLKLRTLGIEGLDEADDFYGPSLALGSADVSLWEMVNAYRTLANGGLWSELRIASGDKTTQVSRKVFSKEAAFIISDILSDREARSQTFGLENPLSVRFSAAVKTGTSKDMRDNWCIGYSDKYTVGVWVGNFSGEPMWNVSGVTGAAPVWAEITNWLHHNGPVLKLKPPPGVVAKRISFSGLEPERKEWFIKGTEPQEKESRFAMKAKPRIVYPAQGMILALDPDIPEGQQMMLFETDSGDNNMKWLIDGEFVGEGSFLSWTPNPGKHLLTLVDTEDLVLDSVSFVVKGNDTEN